MKTLYEVMGWENAENPQEPDTRSTHTRKTDAMKNAQTMRGKYNLVEVNLLSVSPWDENDIRGCELLASWENGKKIS